MKLLVFISVALLFPLLAFSQISEIEKRIDSLRTEMSDNTESGLSLKNELAFLLIKSGEISNAKSLVIETIHSELKQGVSDTVAWKFLNPKSSGD